MAFVGMILDILLIGLLAATVYFVLRLHNRLEVIRGGKGDLEALLRELVATTTNAERSLSGLRISAQDLSETLGKQIKGANNASEELSYLLASADNKAKQLLNVVESVKMPAAAAAMAAHTAEPTPTLRATADERPVVTSAAPATAATDKRQQAENDLLKAIEKLR